MNQQLAPQSLAIYQALSHTKYMTAKNLASKLGIFPQAAFRAIKPLEKLGVVESTGRYPKKYRIKASEESLDSYLQIAQEQYIKTFLSSIKSPKSLLQKLNVTFIQNREELLKRMNADVAKAKMKIDNIVSGEEVPAETILARKNAISRGVKFRFIVQHVDEFYKYMFSNWKKLGAEVKYYPLVEARIIIIDDRIVYITSYNHKAKNEAVGVRFDYPPIAKLMTELFEKRWAKAQEV